VVNIDDVYVDDSSGLTDTGNIHVTAKRPTTRSIANFDTLLGTGAVNERPISETNGREQATATQVTEGYDIEARSVGDVDLSTAAIVARTAWIWSKMGAGAGGQTTTIVNNGTGTGVTLTTSSALYTNIVDSISYTDTQPAVGEKSTGNQATFLYE